MLVMALEGVELSGTPKILFMLKSARPLSILNARHNVLRQLPNSLLLYTVHCARSLSSDSKPSKTAEISSKLTFSQSAHQPPIVRDETAEKLFQRAASLPFKRLPLFDLIEAIEYATEWYTQNCIICLRNSEWMKGHYLGYSKLHGISFCRKCYAVAYCCPEHQAEHALEHARTCDNIVYLRNALMANAILSESEFGLASVKKAMGRVPGVDTRLNCLRRCVHFLLKYEFSYPLNGGRIVHGELVGTTADEFLQEKLTHGGGSSDLKKVDFVEGVLTAIDPSASTNRLLQDLPDPDDILIPDKTVYVHFDHLIVRPPVFLFDAVPSSNFH
jgi:hypothetical protein